MKKYEEPIISVKSLNHNESVMLTASINEGPTTQPSMTNQQQSANWNNWSK